MNKLCFFDRKRKFIRAFNRSQAHEPAGFLVLSSTNKKHRQSGACLMVACLHETCTKDTNIFQGSRKVLQSKSFLGKGATRVSGTVFVVRQKLANGAELRRGGGAKGIRTPDLLNAIQTRYQLRYNPITDTLYRKMPLNGKQFVARKTQFLCPSCIFSTVMLYSKYI